MTTEKRKEDGVNLASKVSADVAKAFRDQAKDRRQQVKYNLEAAVKLWISLPLEIQARLLSRSVSDNDFIEIIREIVLDRFSDGSRHAQNTTLPRKQRPSRKG